jgi:tetratricopeptide (TPR) repeat protein
VLRSDLGSMGARHAITGWAATGTAPATPQAWQDAHDDLAAALQATPDNPGLQEHMGDLYVVAGRRDWDQPAQRQAHFAQALRYYQAALALRPGDAQTWASLAAAHQGLGETGQPMHQAWQRALQLGANEGYVQPMLLDMVLATWKQATPEMRDWASKLFDAGSAGQQEAINTVAARYGLHFEPEEAAGAAPPASAAFGR